MTYKHCLGLVFYEIMVLIVIKINGQGFAKKERIKISALQNNL